MTLLLVSLAFASGPRPSLTVAADGARVDVDMVIYERGEPGLGDLWDLIRYEGADAEYLLDDHTFTPDEAVDAGSACYEIGGDTGFEGCDVSPDECTDCDGDGTPECSPGGECVTWYAFRHTDACLLPGTWDYELAAEGASGSLTTTTTVEDLGQDCVDTGGDSGAGDTGGEDTGGAGGGSTSDSGCSCATGAATPALLLPGLALAALATRRRR